MLKIYAEELFADRPQCVFFDLDNTLYPYAPAHEAAMSATLSKATKLLGVSAAEIKEAFDTAREDVKKRLGFTASSHSRLLYFTRSIELLGFKTQPLFVLDLEQTYWRTFLHNIKLFDGVLSFLSALHGAGIVVALVTDLTAQIQFRKVLFLDIENYLDFIVTSEESGKDKPAEESFILALHKTGIPPEKTWMIGDSSVDIIGGKACRLTTLLRISAMQSNCVESPHMVFSSFEELHKFMLNKKWLEY